MRSRHARPPHRLESSDRLEVVLLEVLGDLLAEHRSLHLGRTKVDAGPHSSIDDLVERVGEPLKASRRTGFVAERAEANLVSAEEVLERIYERTSRARVSSGWSGKGGVKSGARAVQVCVDGSNSGSHVGSA